MDPRAPAVDFRAVFEEHFDYVWNTLRRLGVDERDLEDVAHEVFLRVHARLADYDPSRPMRAWLFGFAFRMAADYRRLSRHTAEVLGGAGQATDPASPADEQVAVRERHALLASALERVPVERRAVLVMHDIDGIAVPVIADTLGIPLDTAYSRLRVARAQLKQALGRLRRREDGP